MMTFACFVAVGVAIASATLGNHGSEKVTWGKEGKSSFWTPKNWPRVKATHVIYEDHHWHYATELTKENVDEYVKRNVDSGKTVFIRWVSEKDDHDCVTQSAAWNDMIRNFYGNKDITFGDVLFSKDKVDTIHGVKQYVGNGGWPTVRHFNKETGYGGQAYKRQTKEPLCDELGVKNLAEWDFLRRYMEDKADTFLCYSDWHILNMKGHLAATPNTGCEQWHRMYIDKFVSATYDNRTAWIDTMKQERTKLIKVLEDEFHIQALGVEHRMNEKVRHFRPDKAFPDHNWSEAWREHHVLGNNTWYTDKQMLRNKLMIIEELIRKASVDRETENAEHRRHEHDDWWDPKTPNNQRAVEL